MKHLVALCNTKSICIGKTYVAIGESKYFYEIEGVGRSLKTNFTEDISKFKNMQKKVKCIIDAGYKNLTVGKEYTVSNQSKEGNTVYVFITNDAGISTRYNEKYFTEIKLFEADDKKIEEPEIKAVPKGMARCLVECLGLTKDELYTVVNEHPNTIEVKTKEGKPGVFLKAKFEIGR